MSQIEGTREHLINVYRKKAKHYDITSRLYPTPGYPQQAQRRRAVTALDLRPGDTVIDIACGTGLNFPLLEQAIGPHGRIIGVDLTDAMLTQAQHRTHTNGWNNISLIHADAAEFTFPTDIDAVLSTYALTQIPDCAQVITHAAAALRTGRHCTVLDLKIPDNTPRWLTQLATAPIRRFTSIDEWTTRRPWETIRTTMQQQLTDLSWTDLFHGTAFLATATHQPATDNPPPHGHQ